MPKLILLCLVAKKVLNPPQETFPFLFLFEGLFVFLFGFFVLFQRRAVRVDFELHHFSFFFGAKLESYASPKIVENIEVISNHAVVLLEAIVDLNFENE